MFNIKIINLNCFNILLNQKYKKIYFLIIFLLFYKINFLLNYNLKKCDNTIFKSIKYSIMFTEAAISRVKLFNNIKTNELKQWNENRYIQLIFFIYINLILQYNKKILLKKQI